MIYSIRLPAYLNPHLCHRGPKFNEVCNFLLPIIIDSLWYVCGGECLVNLWCMYNYGKLMDKLERKHSNYIIIALN